MYNFRIYTILFFMVFYCSAALCSDEDNILIFLPAIRSHQTNRPDPIQRSGDITSDETWNGIVEITGDVRILAPAVVTITPGTVIKFAPHSDDQGGGGSSPITDPNFPHDPATAPSQMSCISVSGGSLYAVGTAQERIIFTSSSSAPAPGDWHSIQYDQLGGRMVIQYATIEYAYYGIQLNTQMNDSLVTVDNNIIRQIIACGICCSPEQQINITLSNNDLSYCGHEAIDTHTYTQATIINNLIHDNIGGPDNGGNGIIVDRNSSAIRNNRITNNLTGIYIIGSTNRPVITNNHYEDNTYADCIWENGRSCE